MNITVAQCSLNAYFETRTLFTKNLLDSTRQRIIENPDNTYVLSRCFLIDLEKYFDEKNPFHDEYTSFITELLDTRSTSIECDPSNQENSFEFLCNSYQSNNLHYGILEERLHDTNVKMCIEIKKIAKPNKGFILSQLLQSQVCVFRYFDFADQTIINSFFNDIFTLSDRKSNVYIIDRQTNLNHNLYDSLINPGSTLKYYTFRLGMAEANFIRGKFIGMNCEIYTTSTVDLLHERMVMYDNFIITSDEDPFNIDINRKTWSITVEYSRTNTYKAMTKFPSFIRSLL